MKFKYNKQEFTGSYGCIKRQLIKHLNDSSFWLTGNKFHLCDEELQRGTLSSYNLNYVRELLTLRVIARMPKLEEYFDENAKIQFNNGLIQIHIDGIIIGCSEESMSSKYLQEIKEKWINEN